MEYKNPCSCFAIIFKDDLLFNRSKKNIASNILSIGRRLSCCNDDTICYNIFLAFLYISRAAPSGNLLIDCVSAWTLDPEVSLKPASPNP